MICKKTLLASLKLATIVSISMIVFLLSACSPHPGAGHWKAEGKNDLNISWINVVFEGTADIFAHGQQDSILRCFWAAKDENSLQFQCVYAEDTEKKATYQFVVAESGRKARLMQGEQLIAEFSEEIPQEKETFPKTDQ